jgi:hypothetical protein
LFPLYFDEDASRGALVRALRARDVDLLTAYECQRAGIPDEEQLAYASEIGRSIYTYNVGDFLRLHREWVQIGRRHAGIILCQQDRWGIGEQVRRLAALVSALTVDEMMNRAEFLRDWEPMR